MLNLEMADYERSLEKMQEEITQLKTMLESKTKETLSVQKEADAVRSQKSKSDETATKLKAMLVKTKKELERVKESNATLTTEMAAVTQKHQVSNEELENLKLDMSTSMAGGQQRVQQLESAVTSLQRLLNSTQEQKDTLNQELEVVKNEYETYKVRFPSSLRMGVR